MLVRSWLVLLLVVLVALSSAPLALAASPEGTMTWAST